MSSLLIGNIIALIASLLMVFSGLLKKKKQILYIQTIQIGLSVISNIVLGGITGAIINLLSCIRNILCYIGKLTLLSKIVLIFFSVLLTLMFNNLGFIGLLPLISIVSYTCLIDINEVIRFKLLIIFTMLLWFVYDLYIKSYSSAIFDFMNIVFNTFSIMKIKNNKL